MKKIIMAAAVIGLGLGFAKASSSSFMGRTTTGTSHLQMTPAANNTTTVCYQLCDLNGKCYTECSVITK